MRPVRRPPAPREYAEEPAYTCAGSTDQTEPCHVPAFLAEDLNRHLLSRVMSVIITSATGKTFRAVVIGALEEAGQEAAEADEICRSTASIPAWLMASEQAPEGGEVLSRFIDRIRVEPGAARSSTGCRCPRELRWPARSARPSSCRNRYGPDPELRAYSSGPKSEPDWARR